MTTCRNRRGRGSPRLTTTEIRTLRRLAAAGRNAGHIALRLARSLDTIKRRAKALGIQFTANPPAA